MSSKQRVERTLDDVSRELLGELSVSERLQLFVEAAGLGNDEWVTLLDETAPLKAYEIHDFEYQRAVGMVSTLSVVANAQLARCCLEVSLARSQRESQLMAVLVGEALGQRLEAKAESEARGLDSMSTTARTGLFETVTREVFEESAVVDRTAWVDEVLIQVASDAAWAGDAVEWLLCDLEVIRAHLRLYRLVHVWRHVATDHLGTSLDELLSITHVPETSLGSVGRPVDEAHCEWFLEGIDASIQRCREFSGDEGEALSRETLQDEAVSLADEVAAWFELPRDSDETEGWDRV
jgi:hypothetical protein